MIYSRDRITEEVIANRTRVRSVYRTPEGQEELFNIFHDGGLFRMATKKELDARNRALLKAQEMGFLDEGVIRHVIDYLLTSGIVEKIEADSKYDPEKDYK